MTRQGLDGGHTPQLGSHRHTRIVGLYESDHTLARLAGHIQALGAEGDGQFDQGWRHLDDTPACRSLRLDEHRRLVARPRSFRRLPADAPVAA
jgi:hypothetical protein